MCLRVAESQSAVGKIFEWSAPDHAWAACGKRYLAKDVRVKIRGDHYPDDGYVWMH